MRNTTALLCLLGLAAPAAAQLGGPPETALTAAFTNGDDTLALRRSSLNGGAMLGQAGIFKLNLNGNLTHIQSSASGYFPGEIYRTTLNLNANTQDLHLTAILNSDSDKPYHSAKETDLGFNIMKDLPEPGTRGVWMMGLNYSTRRSFLRGMPIPYISYRYASDNLMVALPFILRWQARKELAFSAMWQPVKYYKLGVNWRPSKVFSADLEGGTSLEQYLVARRTDKGDALYLETTCITLKPAWKLSRRLELGASLGWQFSGRYYTGRSYDDYNYKRHTGSGGISGLSLKYTFAGPPQPAQKEIKENLN